MNLKTLFIYLMGIGYVWVGFQHFIDTSFFLKIMPPSFPLHKESVYVSGALEILFGIGIIFKKNGLILYGNYIAINSCISCQYIFSI